jgi:hypothetical protein
MDPFLKNKFDGRFGRAVVLENPKGFLRLDDLTGGRPPAEAPRMTEPLAFRQVRVTSLLGTPTRDQNVGGILRGDRSQHLIFVTVRGHKSPPIPSSTSWCAGLGKSSVTGHGSIIVAKKRESEAVGSIDPHVVKRLNNTVPHFFRRLKNGDRTGEIPENLPRPGEDSTRDSN